MLSAGSVVVDTNVFGARLRPGGGGLAALYAELIADRALIISFITVAELEFGERRASWGAARQAALTALVERATVVWPGAGVMGRYVELRALAAGAGHGLAQRDHEADRWIAATALFLGVPLISHDRVFIGAPGLDLVTMA